MRIFDYSQINDSLHSIEGISTTDARLQANQIIGNYRIIRPLGEYQGAKGDAEDIAQEILLKLVDILRHGKYSASSGKFRCYLATLIRREVIDFWRRGEARAADAQISLDNPDAGLEIPCTFDAGDELDLKWRLARHEAAVAVPTKTELERAKPVVENMTKADLAAYKAGETTAQKVAAAHVAYAQKTESEAAKYLLYQGAFKLYARCGEYDLAADTIVAMNRNVKDIPPEVIAEIVGDELRYAPDDKAPRLVAMLKEAKGAVENVSSPSATDTARPRVRGSLLARRKDMKDTTHLQATIDGYTWSYRVDNGEATIEAKKDGKFVCAVSPNPTGDVVIPSMMNGVRVTGIGQEAFCHYCGLKSVNIPSGVKRINEKVFDLCNNLTFIEIPNGVESIDLAAFYNCWGLKEVAIPSSVRVIGPAAFNRCHGLRSLTIGSGVKEIGEVAFEFCGGLTEVTMLGERPNAPQGIFKGCDKLTGIHVPATAKSWAGMKEWQGKKLVFDAKEK